jgi:hypothetical protein
MHFDNKIFMFKIRDIFDASNMVKTTYNHRMDGALNYVKNMNVPKDTQDRVRTWFIYNWQQQKVIGRWRYMEHFPYTFKYFIRQLAHDSIRKQF